MISFQQQEMPNLRSLSLELHLHPQSANMVYKCLVAEDLKAIAARCPGLEELKVYFLKKNFFLLLLLSLSLSSLSPSSLFPLPLLDFIPFRKNFFFFFGIEKKIKNHCHQLNFLVPKTQMNVNDIMLKVIDACPRVKKKIHIPFFL